MTKIYLVKIYLKNSNAPYHYAAFTNKKKAKIYCEVNEIRYGTEERTEIEELEIYTFSYEEELKKLKGAI